MNDELLNLKAGDTCYVDTREATVEKRYRARNRERVRVIAKDTATAVAIYELQTDLGRLRWVLKVSKKLRGALRGESEGRTYALQLKCQSKLRVLEDAVSIYMCVDNVDFEKLTEHLDAAIVALKSKKPVV